MPVFLMLDSFLQPLFFPQFRIVIEAESIKDQTLQCTEFTQRAGPHLHPFSLLFLPQTLAGPSQPSEKAVAPHSSTLAWKIPWTEEPDRLQPMGSLRVGTTEWLHFHFSLSCIGEGNVNPLRCSCLENPRDGGAWWAAVYGVAQSRTGLKPLSSSQSRRLMFLFLWITVAVWISGSRLRFPDHPFSV